MAARWFSFVIWAVVAGSVAAWSLRLLVTPRPTPLHAVSVDMAVSSRGDLTRLFGVPAVSVASPDAPVASDARFKLLGVAASRAAQASEGFALIAIDGKPARAFRVGHVVDGDNVLQSVRPRGASIGPRGGQAAVALEIPPLPPAATGTLPVSTTPQPPPQPMQAVPALPPPPALPPQPGPAPQPELPQPTAPQS